MAGVLDIFGDAGLHKGRPAVGAARLRWARQRHAALNMAVQGVRIGDRVGVELKPNVYWSGRVEAWRKGGQQALALQSATVAEIRLDPGHPQWTSPVIVRRRDRLFPLKQV
jgi:hypothetical protein